MPRRFQLTSRMPEARKFVVPEMLHSSLSTLSLLVDGDSDSFSVFVRLDSSTMSAQENLRLLQPNGHELIDTRARTVGGECGTQGRDELRPRFIGICRISCLSRPRPTLLRKSPAPVLFRKLGSQSAKVVQEQKWRDGLDGLGHVVEKPLYGLSQTGVRCRGPRTMPIDQYRMRSC